MRYYTFSQVLTELMNNRSVPNSDSNYVAARYAAKITGRELIDSGIGITRHLYLGRRGK